MRPARAKPRRRPRRDSLSRLLGSVTTVHDDLRERQTCGGVQVWHPAGVHNVRASRCIPAQRLRCASDPGRRGIMTRLRNAPLFAAVMAGDYAVLTLIDRQLVDFGVTAVICAGFSLAAGLIAYAGRRRRQAVTRGRAAVWERRDQQ